MEAVDQLDLFNVSTGSAQRDVPGRRTDPGTACDTLDDDSLLVAIPNAGIRESVALVAEAGGRRLAAAIPVLEALCRRFAGFGATRIVPEQAAALDALVMIGGSDAAQTVVRLIANRIVQCPCLRLAVAAATRMGAKLPSGMAAELLRHDDLQVRADACRCTRAWPEAIPLLRDLLDDVHAEVRQTAACALGRMGRAEVRALLIGYLREKPSSELVDAIAPIADDECAILLGRVARTQPRLSEAALEALRSIGNPRAKQVAATVHCNTTG